MAVAIRRITGLYTHEAIDGDQTVYWFIDYLSIELGFIAYRFGRKLHHHHYKTSVSALLVCGTELS